MPNFKLSKNPSEIENERKKQYKSDERRREYMRLYRARRKEKEKEKKLAEVPLVEEQQEKDIDFESFVPFSTIVLTDRIMTPQDLLVRGHCKRPTSPRRSSKLNEERNREYKVRKKLQEKGLHHSESNTNVYSVTTEPEEPAPSNVLQIGYVIPQTNVPGSPIIVPCPGTSNDYNTIQIRNLNPKQPIQNVVLPQPSMPGQPFLVPTPTVASTTLQMGDINKVLSIPNIVVPQSSVPGPSFIVPVPSGNPTGSNALQIGNLGQVLLIENKVLPQGSMAGPPPLVLMKGNVMKDLKNPLEEVQDYDDLIPSSVTIGRQVPPKRLCNRSKKKKPVEVIDKPEYWYPKESENYLENDEKNNIDLGEIVLNEVKYSNQYQQFLDETIPEPQIQSHFVGIKQEYDPENCKNNESNEIFIKKEHIEEDEPHSNVDLKPENSVLNTSIIVKEEVKNEEDTAD